MNSVLKTLKKESGMIITYSMHHDDQIRPRSECGKERKRKVQTQSKIAEQRL